MNTTSTTSCLDARDKQSLETRTGEITIKGIYPNRTNKPRVKVLLTIGNTLARLFVRDQELADRLIDKIKQFDKPVVVSAIGYFDWRGEFNIFRITQWPAPKRLARSAEAI
jgi:hypothetical protein